MHNPCAVKSGQRERQKVNERVIESVWVLMRVNFKEEEDKRTNQIKRLCGLLLWLRSSCAHESIELSTSTTELTRQLRVNECQHLCFGWWMRDAWLHCRTLYYCRNWISAPTVTVCRSNFFLPSLNIFSPALPSKQMVSSGRRSLNVGSPLNIRQHVQVCVCASESKKALHLRLMRWWRLEDFLFVGTND